MNVTQSQPDTTAAPTVPQRSGEAQVGPGEAAGASHVAAPAQYSQYQQPQTRIDDPRRKSPALACILSALPGLGQIYVGYYPRGFVHAIVVAVLIAFLATADFSPLIPLGAFFLAFFWLYNIIDAGRRAAMYNQVLAGGTAPDLPSDFPSDISLPSMRGSIVGGVVLIVVGAIALSNTVYGVPLDWLEDWWPLALFLVGGYLLVKGILERSATRPSDEAP